MVDQSKDIPSTEVEEDFSQDMLCGSSGAEKLHFLSVMFIVLLTLVVYANSLKNDFINWDDPGLVIENTSIRSLSLDNIINIFTPQTGRTYQPVRVLSYAIDYYF